MKCFYAWLLNNVFTLSFLFFVLYPKDILESNQHHQHPRGNFTLLKILVIIFKCVTNVGMFSVIEHSKPVQGKLYDLHVHCFILYKIMARYMNSSSYPYTLFTPMHIETTSGIAGGGINGLCFGVGGITIHMILPRGKGGFRKTTLWTPPVY